MEPLLPPLDSTKAAQALLTPQPRSNHLPLIAAIGGLLIILAAGVWYYLRETIPEVQPGGGTAMEDTAGSDSSVDVEAAALLQQSSSDDIGKIEEDLSAQGFDGLDRELADINAALEAQ